jgi:hypothetical protein
MREVERLEGQSMLGMVLLYETLSDEWMRSYATHVRDFKLLVYAALSY